MIFITTAKPILIREQLAHLIIENSGNKDLNRHSGGRLRHSCGEPVREKRKTRMLYQMFDQERWKRLGRRDSTFVEQNKPDKTISGRISGADFWALLFLGEK